MKRTLLGLLIASPIVLLTVWITRNTEWVDTIVPMPPKGEALTNPFYAVERFARSLGARTVRDPVFVAPPTDAIVVLSTWHWTLSSERQRALERWVEAGGRLVVDDSIVGGEKALAGWSRIERGPRGLRRMAARDDPAQRAETYRMPCRSVEEQPREKGPRAPTAVRVLCNVSELSSLNPKRTTEWSLRDGNDVHAARVRVGRGSVTRINAVPFRALGLLEGDNAWLFVAAAQLRRGDEVHFLSEADHASLLALTWRHGAPVVVLGFTAIAMMLWRGGVRLGPVAPLAPPVRRSLAEQIRGTGRFAVSHRGGAALHAAAVRALEEAAARQVPGYVRLPRAERAAALARMSSFSRGALEPAVFHPPSERPRELRSTLMLLESARRRVLDEHTRLRHAAD